MDEKQARGVEFTGYTGARVLRLLTRTEGNSPTPKEVVSELQSLEKPISNRSIDWARELVQGLATVPRPVVAATILACFEASKAEASTRKDEDDTASLRRQANAISSMRAQEDLANTVSRHTGIGSRTTLKVIQEADLAEARPRIEKRLAKAEDYVPRITRIDTANEAIALVRAFQTSTDSPEIQTETIRRLRDTIEKLQESNPVLHAYLAAMAVDMQRII
jgi:hypothetical protein